MKNLLGVLLIVGVINLTFSQDFKGKITYQASMVVDESPSNNPKFIVISAKDVVMSEEFKDLEVKSGKDALPINFLLIFDGEESLYRSELDFEETKKLKLLMNQTNLVGRQNQLYYTNVETNEKIFQSHWTQNVIVNMDDIDWVLKNETKEIGNYTAKKAIAIISSEQTYGMNYLSPVEAWYTPDVSLPFGIQNFTGLPGLTLELIADYQEGKIRYLATDIDLDSAEEIYIEKPKGNQLLSEKEYVELIKDLNAQRKSH
jgi:GLPGLI family protein